MINYFDISIAVALLSGARNHRNSILSQQLFDRMKHLFPDNKNRLISAATLLSNTYSSVGEDVQAEQVRLNRIKHLGKKNIMGMSWAEYNGELVVRIFYSNKRQEQKYCIL